MEGGDRLVVGESPPPGVGMCLNNVSGVIGVDPEAAPVVLGSGDDGRAVTVKGRGWPLGPRRVGELLAERLDADPSLLVRLRLFGVPLSEIEAGEETLQMNAVESICFGTYLIFELTLLDDGLELDFGLEKTSRIHQSGWPSRGSG